MTKLSFAYALLLLGVFSPGGVTGSKPTPFLENFKVTVESNPYRRGARRGGPLSKTTILNRSNKIDVDEIKAFVDNARREANDIGEKLWTEANDVYEKVQTQLKEIMKQYSKAEIGAYAALALSLTIAMKAVFFKKAPFKSLDVGIISFILCSEYAIDRLSKVVAVEELECSKSTLNFCVSPSISSRDGKTYRQMIPKVARKRVPAKIPPSPPPTRPAQVVVDTVTAFYEEHVASPASHNAVVKTMTPAMRKSLRVRRIRGGAEESGLAHTLLVGFYFAAWYALNVIYNIVNKKVLNVLPAPLMVGTVQFAVGALYCALVWLIGLRPCPTLTESGKKAVAGVGLYHSFGQLASMVSLGAGPVSFTHIVKAMEPFFSALVSGLVFHKWMKPQVYATLIPVVGGVGYACLKELNFSWLAFGAAMASNVAFALRAVMSKSALQSGAGAGTNLSPPNMFGLVTWAAFFISIPIALIGEGAGFNQLLSESLESVENNMQFLRAVILSGLFHYLNNEVMYLALGSVHPVTLAVGNTMKRVFILVASVMVFRNPISLQAGIGSAVGIAGVLLYSLTKQYYENLEAAELASKKGGHNKKAPAKQKPVKKVPVKKR